MSISSAVGIIAPGDSAISPFSRNPIPCGISVIGRPDSAFRQFCKKTRKLCSDSFRKTMSAQSFSKSSS